MSITKVLPVTLTTDEVAAKASELASTLQELATQTEDARTVAARAKETIKGLETKVTGLASMVRDHIEYRPVKCAEVRNDVELTITTVRMDTGERVSVRAMTDSERQLKMFPVAVDEVEQA